MAGSRYRITIPTAAAGHGRFDCPGEGALGDFCSAFSSWAGWPAAVGRSCFFFSFLFSFGCTLRMSAAGSQETIALVAGPLSVFGPRGPSPQVGSRTPAGTAHVCLFESALVIVIPGGHCSRRSTAWTWCRRVGRTYRVLQSTSDRYQPQCLSRPVPACCGGEHCRFQGIPPRQRDRLPGPGSLVAREPNNYTLPTPPPPWVPEP